MAGNENDPRLDVYIVDCKCEFQIMVAVPKGTKPSTWSLESYASNEAVDNCHEFDVYARKAYLGELADNWEDDCIIYSDISLDSIPGQLTVERAWALAKEDEDG